MGVDVLYHFILIGYLHKGKSYIYTYDIQVSHMNLLFLHEKHYKKSRLIIVH